MAKKSKTNGSGVSLDLPDDPVVLAEQHLKQTTDLLQAERRRLSELGGKRTAYAQTLDKAQEERKAGYSTYTKLLPDCSCPKPSILFHSLSLIASKLIQILERETGISKSVPCLMTSALRKVPS